MTFAAGVTFTSDILYAAFCFLEKKVHNTRVIGADCTILQLLTDIYAGPCMLFVPCTPAADKTCYAKRANKTAKCTVAGCFEASVDFAITKIKLMDGYLLDADVIVFGVSGRPLQALDKDHLAEEKGALMTNALYEITFPGKFIFPLRLYNMLKVEYVDLSLLSARRVVEMTGKVASVMQPVASLGVFSELGISVSSKHRIKSMSPQLRVTTMCQMWLFLLVILLSASQVLSSAEAKKESADIGSCRFDLMSVATLSCVEPGGNWRPPSMACCNALLYAIDLLPAGNESGACCLCRYLDKKYSHFALATSYVLCQGKDKHIVTTWSSFPLYCYKACHRRNASSHGMGTPAQKDFPAVNVQDTAGRSNSKMVWIAAVAAAAFNVILLACCCYRWWHKPVPNSCESQPLNLQRRRLRRETREEHRSSGMHSSAQRRSSRGSPNG
uniref:Uncharacterized protein n=1 Tax=Arundo donax TaxID=35708 RepID=A0A0A8XY04_ARUDO